jgi:pyridoxal phosphate enzyme (YggS family)
MPETAERRKQGAAVRERFVRVREDVAEAALRAGRNPAQVRLMAVTKTVDEWLIREAVEAGTDLLGENKVQEIQRKRGNLPPAEMHLIGHLQRNKAAKAAECADMIQSLDSVALARELSAAGGKLGRTIPVLLEVNIGRDEAKFGFPPEQTAAALEEIMRLPCLSVRGLMTVPPFLADERQTRAFFSQMMQLFIDIRDKTLDNISKEAHAMEVLSMGMSGDYPWAIAEGSTLVRVGTAIFGMRDYR